MAEIKLEKSIIDGLTSRGVLAYVAVKMAEGSRATTAVLAELVGAQSSVMKEGLEQLSLAAPGLVLRDGNKWMCGEPKGDGQVMSLVASRYQAFVDDLKKYWDYFNKPTPFTITPKDGATIQRFLKDYSGWGPVEWAVALHNRMVSIIEFQHASRSEPFYAWIPKLSNYEASPLDRFNKPAEGSERHGKIHSIQQGNRDEGSKFIDRLRAADSAEGYGDRDLLKKVRSV